MSISIDQMREVIIDAYPGDLWRGKVNAMHDNQIIAIYQSMLHRFKSKNNRKSTKVCNSTSGRSSKTVSEPSKKPCERLFVGETDSCESGKQVGFDELMRGL